ncbi:VIT family-domain-containing protein [Apiospora arundinis]
MDGGNDSRTSSAQEAKGFSNNDAPSPAFSRTSDMSFARSDITLTEHTPARSKPSSRLLRLPTLSRFLADFTLGFADGLTVPFALTAGLSSLGKTQTVIYAGMAEICAGSISMGIGGYLAAKGEQQAAVVNSNSSVDGDGDAVDEEEKQCALGSSNTDDVLENYLAPLGLRGELRAAVEAHVRKQPDLVAGLRMNALGEDAEAGFGERASSPVVVGLSVSVGYLLGGLLPLFPYFFVSQVADGLRWSFGVCILALFVFGFTKHYLLQDDAQRHHHRHPRKTPQWKRLRASLWEGTQMVVLGSIAAVTAVLAVKALEGLASDD